MYAPSGKLGLSGTDDTNADQGRWEDCRRLKQGERCSRSKVLSLSCPMRWISVRGQACVLASTCGVLALAALDCLICLGGGSTARVAAE